ncbi:50S ribosomal protein L11 methyltransferase [Prochlorococcus marinus]|uniref:Ribosomal protein L11 methyltransferase n=1 Tax=Prochlorococcus marinus XMU1408 TaxID=2213228 RepID=A0A318R192_PROMR|nr:50S ribosomal protein L11 methyltransferase [Prochlorococcus marinus]MBW3042538.1 50S ribosomal protein L11 methyltransferase [Prochlorococcus marinus str. XMU1408]PYE01263.1 50S ribosomal protein L11 methyltransferase [Prochlorococcus marinus XMU1408]
MLIEKDIDLQKSQVSWLRLEQEIPLELEDSFYWLLNNLKIHRFSFEHEPGNNFSQILFIWLPLNEWKIKDRDDLVQSFNSLAEPFELTLPVCKWVQVKDEDWSSTWKKSWKPDPVGKSILILPAWLDLPGKFSGRKIIRLDPGYAFGTGSHPSTRLCIEALDNDPPVGKTIADLGCGSGILSLTALKLGANSTYAVDTDCLAISATKINADLNDFPKHLLNVSLGSIEELEVNIPKTKIDLMLCNILAPVIKSLGPDFEKIIGHQGKVILSGLLIAQIKEIQEFFLPLGWEVLETQTKDQWALMALTRKLS